LQAILEVFLDTFTKSLVRVKDQDNCVIWEKYDKANPGKEFRELFDGSSREKSNLVAAIPGKNRR